MRRTQSRSRCNNSTTFKVCRILLLLFFALQTAVQGTAKADTGVVSEYNRDGLSFSLVLPQDWDVVQNASGFELFAEPKEKAKPTAANPVVADPNITVTASRNPMPIDQDSLEKYSLQIISGLQKSLGESAKAEIFLKRLIEIKNKRSALLYYLRYKKGQFEVYNAIVVASTDTHLFRVTLTDYSVSFDANLEKLFPYISTLDVGSGNAARPDLLKIVTPWVGGAFAFLILLLVLNAVRIRLSQSQLSGALSESVYEQRNSTHPFSKAVEFKGNEMNEDYDPEFRQSSEASRYHGADNFTEVPLSQAIGSDAEGSQHSFERESRRGSVVDPETEVSGFSGSMSKVETSALGSFSKTSGETTETKKIVPPPPPGAAKASSQNSAAFKSQAHSSHAKQKASESSTSVTKTSSVGAKSGAANSKNPASSGFGLEFTKARDDDEV